MLIRRMPGGGLRPCVRDDGCESVGWDLIFQRAEPVPAFAGVDEEFCLDAHRDSRNVPKRRHIPAVPAVLRAMPRILLIVNIII